MKSKKLLTALIIVIVIVAAAALAVPVLLSLGDSISFENVDTSLGQRADYKLNFGKNVRSAKLTVEMWKDGECISSAPLNLNSDAESLTLLFSDRRSEDGYLEGVNVQIDTDDTVGSLITYFEGPEGSSGYAFSALSDYKRVKLHSGDELFLAAMCFDYGDFVLSASCNLLSETPDIVKTAGCMLVVRAEFSSESVPSQASEAVK